MRLPQVSSNRTAVIGPMLLGSPRKLTPRSLSRRCSEAMSFRYESSGWNAGGKQCCLIRLTRRKTHRLQHELDTFRPSGEDTVNQRKGPMGMSLFFTKPKMVV